MKYYKIGKYHNAEIKSIDVEKETDLCIWVLDWNGKPYRQLKHTSYDDYYKTYDEAKTALKTRAEKRLEYAKKEVAELENDLIAIANL